MPPKEKSRKRTAVLNKEEVEEIPAKVTAPSESIEVNNFQTFWSASIDSIKSAQLSDLKERSRNARKEEIPGLGNCTIYNGVDEISIPTSSTDLSSLGWTAKLVTNMADLLEETEVEEDQEEEVEALRNSLLDIISKYGDVQAITDDQDGYRTIYCAHIISHLIRNKNLIIGNKRKLDIVNASETGATDSQIEECRDQGFVRPVVLVLCPFKKDAYDVIKRIQRIIYGEEEGDVWNRNRFEQEYSGPDVLPQSRVEFPKDHLELLRGNNDDAFRIGVALSKKTLKLYEKFDKADILICSPLGLRMILNGDDGNESHLLSSINITVVDRTDLMLQQNWENVQLIFSHLHSQPAKIDVDISRVRRLYLDGHARHFSQLMVFSRYSHELFTSLTLQNSTNHRGLIVARPKQEGTLTNIEVPLCQEIHRFDVRDANEMSDQRFKYFCDKIVPTLTQRTCLVIPSYFDFVRIRNHFKRAEESFVSCHEYAPRKKIDRAREMFYHQRKSYLLVTERWYYFHRRQLTGIHRLVFYQLPSHPLFYSELINMSDADTKQRFMAVLVVCKYDRMRLENTFGTEMTHAILHNKQSVQAIVSE